MRKALAKLMLHRETLRRLENRELGKVWGADFPTRVCPTANNTCDLTCDLCVTGNCG